MATLSLQPPSQGRWISGPGGRGRAHTRLLCRPTSFSNPQSSWEKLLLCAREQQQRAFSSRGRAQVRAAAVSDRARPVADDRSPYYEGWLAVNSNEYDPRTNSGGCIQLGLADNKLSTDLLEDFLASHETASAPELERSFSFHAIAGYPEHDHGLSIFRSVLANFMDEVFGGDVHFNADQMVVTTGATSATELLAFCLGDPGDVFLVPSPYYPGFNRDVTFRSQVVLVPVRTTRETNFVMTGEALEEAYEDVVRSGRKVKGMLMSSPSNPLGITYDETFLRMVLNFVGEKDIHLICDEIFAGSSFGGPNFVSVAELLASCTGNENYSRVHIIYGLAKVLGLPGYRVGLLYTWNKQVLNAAKGYSRFCSVPSHTQKLMHAVLSDKQFIRSYLSETRKRLAKRWQLVRHGLQEAGLEAIECVSGLFCWVDLRNLLHAKSTEGELEVWRTLLYEEGISITPGSACHCSEPGWFRLCFALVDDQAMMVALSRIKQFSASRERLLQSRVKYNRIS